MTTNETTTICVIETTCYRDITKLPT